MRSCDSDFKLYGADTVLFDEPKTAQEAKEQLESIDVDALNKVLEAFGKGETLLFDLGKRKNCRLVQFEWAHAVHRADKIFLHVEYIDYDSCVWEMGQFHPEFKRERIPIEQVQLAMRRWDGTDIGYLKGDSLNIKFEPAEVNTEALSRALGLDHPGTPRLKPAPPMDRPMRRWDGTYVHKNPTIETFVNEQLEELSWKAFFGKPCVNYTSTGTRAPREWVVNKQYVFRPFDGLYEMQCIQVEPPAWAPITQVEVQSDGCAFTYKETKDYLVDASLGRIYRVPDGNIKRGETVRVSYSYATPQWVSDKDDNRLLNEVSKNLVDKGFIKPDPISDILEMQKLFGSQHTHSCSDELARCMAAFDALPIERRRAILDANKPRVNRFFQVQPRHGTIKAYKDFLQYQDAVAKPLQPNPLFPSTATMENLLDSYAPFRVGRLNKPFALTTDDVIHWDVACRPSLDRTDALTYKIPWRDLAPGQKTKSEDKSMFGYQTYTDGYGSEYRVYANGMHQLINSPTEGVDYAKVRHEQQMVMERAKAEAAEKKRKEKAERDKAEAETKKRYEAAEQAANTARKRAQKAEVNNLFDSVGIRLISLLPEANRAFILKQLNAVHALAGDSLEAA